jgi:hypothetical protein
MDPKQHTPGTKENDEAMRNAIAAEAGRLEEAAVYSAQGQFETAKRWRMAHWLLGLSTSVASASAGVLAFSSGGLQIVAGCLALLGAASGGVHTTLSPDRRSARAAESANGYIALRDDARRLRAIKALRDDCDALRSELNELGMRVAEINQRAAPIPRSAYLRARRNIQEGGQAFGKSSPGQTTGEL